MVPLPRRPAICRYAQIAFDVYFHLGSVEIISPLLEAQVVGTVNSKRHPIIENVTYLEESMAAVAETVPVRFNPELHGPFLRVDIRNCCVGDRTRIAGVDSPADLSWHKRCSGAA